MKINYVVSTKWDHELIKINPFYSKRKRELLNFIKLLESDIDFESEINTLRHKYKIKIKDGRKMTYFDLLDEQYAIIHKVRDKKDLESAELILDLVNVCKKYNCDEVVWFLKFYTLVKFNKLILPDMSYVIDVESESDYLNFRDYFNSVHKVIKAPIGNGLIIMMNEYVSFSQFKKLIEVEWPKIKEHFKTQKPIVKTIIDSRNLEIGKRVVQLRDNKNSMPYKQIANIIEQEFNVIVEYNDVRQIYKRHKDKIKGLKT